MTELIHVVRGDFSIPEGEGTVVLQRYDESWSEWLDVTDETELEDRAKIKVVLLGKKEDASEETKSQAVEATKKYRGHGDGGFNNECFPDDRGKWPSLTLHKC